MSESPKQTHDADQTVAWMRSLGAGFGLMYLEICQIGVSNDVARDIVLEYVRGFAGGAT